MQNKCFYCNDRYYIVSYTRTMTHFSIFSIGELFTGKYLKENRYGLEVSKISPINITTGDIMNEDHLNVERLHFFKKITQNKRTLDNNIMCSPNPTRRNSTIIFVIGKHGTPLAMHFECMMFVCYVIYFEKSKQKNVYE